jgi:hypothetical protein
LLDGGVDACQKVGQQLDDIEGTAPGLQEGEAALRVWQQAPKSVPGDQKPSSLVVWAEAEHCTTAHDWLRHKEAGIVLRHERQTRALAPPALDPSIQPEWL